MEFRAISCLAELRTAAGVSNEVSTRIIFVIIVKFCLCCLVFQPSNSFNLVCGQCGKISLGTPPLGDQPFLR